MTISRVFRFCTIAGAALAVLLGGFTVYTHRMLGGSLFELACISERGSFVANLFMRGRAADHQWWYGVGYTFWNLARVPFCCFLAVLTGAGARWWLNSRRAKAAAAVSVTR